MHVEQIEREIEREIEKGKKDELERRDELFPSSKDDPFEQELAYLCISWFAIKLGIDNVEEERAGKILNNLAIRLAAELNKCKGCSYGKQQVAYRVTADAWNEYKGDGNGKCN